MCGCFLGHGTRRGEKVGSVVLGTFIRSDFDGDIFIATNGLGR